MMPNRILKESICTSDSIDQLTSFQEVLFYRLIVSCDDYGRFDGRPKLIASKLFPLKDIRAQQIEEALRALTSAELVILYEVGGKPFVQMKTWDRHQQIRAKKSKYPAPDGNLETPEETCNQMISDDIKCSRNPIQSESGLYTTTTTARAREDTDLGPVDVDPLIVKVQRELSGLTDTHYQALADYREELTDAVVSYAIDIAVGNGIRAWSYVEAILRGWVSRHIRTVGDAKAERQRHKQTPQKGGKIVGAQMYQQRDYHESEMEEVLGVKDLFKGDAAS